MPRPGSCDSKPKQERREGFEDSRGRSDLWFVSRAHPSAYHTGVPPAPQNTRTTSTNRTGGARRARTQTRAGAAYAIVTAARSVVTAARRLSKFRPRLPQVSLVLCHHARATVTGESMQESEQGHIGHVTLQHTASTRILPSLTFGLGPVCRLEPIEFINRRAVPAVHCEPGVYVQ